jgi:hypothetical protein
MLAKEFIFEKLTSLAKAFPYVVIKYEYNKLAKTHIVELSPIAYYYNDPSLDDAWINISKEFIEQYPSEDISFISVDSSLRINQPEYSFNNEVIKVNLRPIHFSNLNEAVSEVYEEWTTKINWDTISIPTDMTFEYIQSTLFSSTDNFAFTSKPFIDISTLNTTPDYILVSNINISNPTISVEENNYAKAA